MPSLLLISYDWRVRTDISKLSGLLPLQSAKHNSQSLDTTLLLALAPPHQCTRGLVLLPVLFLACHRAVLGLPARVAHLQPDLWGRIVGELELGRAARWVAEGGGSSKRVSLLGGEHN